MDVMLDIETLGTKPGCAVLEVAACTFDLGTGKTGATFETTVKVGPQMDAGLTADWGTISWWMQQEERTRKMVMSEKWSPEQTAFAFSNWFREVGGITIWAQGMDFDPPILAHFMKTFGYNPPWKFWEVRDTRTLCDLARYRTGFDYKRDVPREGTHHRAIDDVLHQVKCCHEAFGRL